MTTTTTPIGLPPREAEHGPDRSPAALRAARVRNLLGLVTPIANLGMLRISPRDIRWLGVGAGVVLCGVAAWAFFRGPAWLVGGALGAHYLLVLLGLVDPRWAEAPARGWIAFGMALGRIVVYPLFALIYFLVVTPLALVMRVLGKDPLQRGAPDAESYWRQRKPAPIERYERQF